MAELEYGFYPGCCFQGTDARLYDIIKKIMDVLNVRLNLIEGAVCCGAGVVEEDDPEKAVMLNAYNIALAEKKNLKFLTPCNTCLYENRKIKHELDNDVDLKKNVNAELAKDNLEYKGTSDITHLLWILVGDIGLEKIRQHVKRPLKGFTAVLYYGCHILRPKDYMIFDDPRNPQSFENLADVLGISFVDYKTKFACCGYHSYYTNRKVSLKLGKRYLDGVHESGADVIVTACPLCFKALDVYQKEMNLDYKIPVFYLPEVVGLAFGFSPEEMMLDWHQISLQPVIKKMGDFE